MTVTAYATQTDIEQLLSSYGVASRAEDRDTSTNAARVSGALEKATVDVNVYLFKIYTLAEVRQSTWAKWATAVFAAVELCRRRGNPIPKSLKDEYDRYLEQLKAIADGSLMLPSDTGLEAPQFDNTPLVSNLTVDSRFAGAPIRRVRPSSTDAQPSPLRKSNEAQTPQFLPW